MAPYLHTPETLPFSHYQAYWHDQAGLTGTDIIKGQVAWWLSITPTAVLEMSVDDILAVPERIAALMAPIERMVTASAALPTWSHEGATYRFTTSTVGMKGEQWLDICEVGMKLAENKSERNLLTLCLLMDDGTPYSGEQRVTACRPAAEACPAWLAASALLAFTERLQPLRMASLGSIPQARKLLQATKERWGHLNL